MIVVDTNIIAYLLVPGEHTAVVEEVLEKDNEWIAPILWRSEFRNILSTCMQVVGLSLKDAHTTMSRAEFLMNGKEYTVPSDLVLEMAESTGLAAYDAEFVTLASQLECSMVTCDSKVLKAVEDIAKTPKHFIS